MPLPIVTAQLLRSANVPWQTGGTYSPTTAYTSWSGSNGTITRSDVLAPNKKLEAMRIVENSAAGTTHGTANTSVSFAQTAIPYVHTVYARRVTGSRNLMIAHFDSAGSLSIQGDIVDLGSGTVIATPTTDGSWTNLSITAQKRPDGWVKVQLFFTGISDTSMWFVYRLASEGNPTYTGDAASSVAVWGTDLRPA